MLLEYKKDHEVRQARPRSWNASSNVQACPSGNPRRAGHAYTHQARTGQPGVPPAIPFLKATETRPCYAVCMTSTFAYNSVVIRCLTGGTTRSLLRPVIGVATLAASGLALILAMALPATIDAVLIVGSIGLAAERYAATKGGPRRASVKRSPANDNPLRPVLPPHLLRC
ncbi:hypothetical protein [uncultured Sphingomonas sp.]|uniref:hypothetical protein n=1 Tax=uncultured Sphingomonas sp. TaxID=158754 RepID=UPI0035CA28C8